MVTWSKTTKLLHTAFFYQEKTLHISALLAVKRFGDRGNKDGAMQVFQKARLGKVHEIKPQRQISTVCKILILFLLAYHIPHMDVYICKVYNGPIKLLVHHDFTVRVELIARGRWMVPLTLVRTSQNSVVCIQSLNVRLHVIYRYSSFRRLMYQTMRRLLHFLP